MYKHTVVFRESYWTLFISK